MGRERADTSEAFSIQGDTKGLKQAAGSGAGCFRARLNCRNRQDRRKWQGFSTRTGLVSKNRAYQQEERTYQSEQDDGWFFGSGATKSRARFTKGKVRACPGGDVAWIVDGGWDGGGAGGSGAFDACAGASAAACYFSSAGADSACQHSSAWAGSSDGDRIECGDSGADAAEFSGD